MMAWSSRQLARRLRGNSAAVITAAVRAVDAFGEHVLAEAREITPVSPTDPNHPLYIGTSGALRDSGTAIATQVRQRKIVKLIGFNTDYAAAVHEVTDPERANHQYEGAVNPKAQAKFLETPMRENARRFGPFVSREIKRAGGAA